MDHLVPQTQTRSFSNPSSTRNREVNLIKSRVLDQIPTRNPSSLLLSDSQPNQVSLPRSYFSKDLPLSKHSRHRSLIQDNPSKLLDISDHNKQIAQMKVLEISDIRNKQALNNSSQRGLSSNQRRKVVFNVNKGRSKSNMPSTSKQDLDESVAKNQYQLSFQETDGLSSAIIGLDEDLVEEFGYKNDDDRSPLLLYVEKDKRAKLGLPALQKGFSSFKDLALEIQQGNLNFTKKISRSNRVLEVPCVAESPPPEGEDDTKILSNNTSVIQKAPPKFDNRNHLAAVKKLLRSNKRSEKSYHNESFAAQEKVRSFVSQKQEEEFFLREQMPAIRVYPSIHYKYLQNGFDEPILNRHSSLKKDSSKPEIAPSNQKKIKFDLTDSRFNQVYKLYWNSTGKEQPSWRPEVREGHTMTTIGEEVFLYGGISTQPIEDLVVYNMRSKKWEKPETIGENPMTGRRGHTACAYEKGIIIFGGQHRFNPVLNFRECLNDVRLYLTDTQEWKLMNCSGKAIETRRNHTATIHKNKMYVYGGVTIEGKSLKDVWILDLKEWTWSQAIVQNDKDMGISLHTMAACFEDPPVKSLVSSSENIRVSKITQQGFYVFGGRDEEGGVLNTLKILTFGRGKDKSMMFWNHPIIKGNAPAARYGHSMVLYKSLSVLIIYGGKNDGPSRGKDEVYFNDICILNLELMSWMPTANYGKPLEIPRYHHAAAICGSKMMIFGGLEPSQFARDSVTYVELSQQAVKKLMKYNPEPEEEDLFSIIGKKEKKTKMVSIAGAESSTKLDGEISVEELTAIPEEESKKMEYKNWISWQPLPRPHRMEKEFQEQRMKSKKKGLGTIIRAIKRGDWNPNNSMLS